MEPEGPLPCSQEPSTGPCPEPEGCYTYASELVHSIVISGLPCTRENYQSLLFSVTIKQRFLPSWI
jgi:hypothetical protein